MLTKTSQHALRALADIARNGNTGPVLVRAISERTGIPANYLSKVLGVLRQNGLVDGTRGRTGGYVLTRDPDAISLLDVASCFEDAAVYRRCFLGNAICSDVAPCSLHPRWAPVAAQVLAFLEQTTIAEIEPYRA